MSRSSTTLCWLVAAVFIACAEEPPPCPPCPKAAPKKVVEKPPAPAAEGSKQLHLEGTPEIPDELRGRLSQYLNTRGGWFGDISDDGGELLVSTRFAETNQLHVVSAPLGARNQLTFLEEPTSSPTFVPGDPQSAVYLSDEGGSEQYRLVRLDRRTGKVTPFSEAGKRVRQYVWNDNGRWIAYNSNARNGKDMDIYVGDGETMLSTRMVVEAKGHWAPLDWSDDGKHILLMEYISIQESRLYVVEAASGEVTRVSPEEPVASYRDAVFAGSSSHVYATSDKGGEFVELYDVDLKTGSWKSLTSEIPWNVSEFALSTDKKRIALTVNEDGFRKLHLLDLRTGNLRLVEGLEGKSVFNPRFARKGNVLGFTVRSASIYADAYRYDADEKKLERWTESEMGGLDTASLIEPETIRYPGFDGKEISAYVIKPRGKGPHPVVIWIHGGPEAQARPYFYALSQYLAVEMGVGVILPNVRGSDGYGKTFLSLDNGMKREGSVNDIGALLDWIEAQDELDQSRVGVFGGSYGGYMVLASMITYADRIAAGVEIVGISNFITFLENTKEYRRDLRRAEYGDERDPEMRAFFEKISPTNNTGKIKSPLFVAQGANDPRVPASESEQIVKAVRAAGKEVWYMLARNEGHGFRKKENRDTFTLLTLMFFEKYLTKPAGTPADGGAPAPAPAPAEGAAGSVNEVGDGDEKVGAKH